MTSVTQQKRLSAAITGAGSGLGRDIALGLAAKNYRVFGTALSPQEIDDLTKATLQMKPQSGVGPARWQLRQTANSIFSSAMLEFSRQGR